VTLPPAAASVRIARRAPTSYSEARRQAALTKTEHLMAGNVPNFTDDNFEKEVLESSLPVVIDLWADWCAPCRALAPTIEALSEELSGKITIGKLDITANPQVPSRFGVTAIPTLLMFQDGKEVGRLVGGGKTAADFKQEFTKAFGVSV
jgi:thioredoxin 1